MEQQKILIKGTNWLGDVIISLPAIKYIKEQNPNSLIVVLSKKNTADIYNLLSFVDGVIEYDFGNTFFDFLKEHIRLRRVCRKNKFNTAYVFPNSFHSAFLSLLSGSEKRIGYARDMRSFMLTKIVPKQAKKTHQVFSYLNIVGNFTNRNIGIADILEVSETQKKEVLDRLLPDFNRDGSKVLIGVAPGAAFGGAKRLPIHKYIQIISEIAKIDENINFVLMGAGDDKKYCDKIFEGITSFDKKRVYNLSGLTTLTEAAVICSSCKVFLSNDSGLMHLAAVSGAKVVAFFGPTNEEHTSPLGDFKIIRSPLKIECVPCMKRECSQHGHLCLESIDINETLEAVKSFL